MIVESGARLGAAVAEVVEESEVIVGILLRVILRQVFFAVTEGEMVGPVGVIEVHSAVHDGDVETFIV